MSGERAFSLVDNTVSAASLDMSAKGALDLGSEGQGQMAHVQPSTHEPKVTFATVASAPGQTRDENQNRAAKRKRYSYPLLGSYETEIPGIHRLPLSPVKSKQTLRTPAGASSSTAAVFRKPLARAVKGTKGQTPLRRASTSMADNPRPVHDIYDPQHIGGPETFSASAFLFQRNQIIRRQTRKVAANDRFAVLPDEMVLKIFGLLGKTALFNCLLVNQRFNELASDEILWKRIDAMGRFLSVEEVSTIFRRNPVYVRLARSLVPAPIDIETFAASQILYLDLSMAVITTTDLARIMSKCTSLIKCSLESLCVTAEVIEAMMCFTSSIDTLNLTMCYDVNFHAFSNFVAGCRNLKSLNLSCMMQTWTKEELLIIMNTLPVGLERLNVAGFVYRMRDEHVKVLVNRLLRLKELDLSDSQEITHKSVQYIVDNLKVLEAVSFSRCYNIRIGAYLLLPTATRLRSVQLFAIFKEPTMTELQATIPQIKFNTDPISAVARPTVGSRRSTIWGERVRD